MRLSLAEQQTLVSEVRREMKAYHAKNLSDKPIERFCLFWAFFTLKALHKRGLKTAQIQAGTAYWPIVSEETDDGVSANQFGYQFTWDKLAYSQVINGEQPEMHAWIAIAEPPVEIVDVTAPFFKERAIKEGFRYDAPDPPDFFWQEGMQFPFGVTYIADVQAIEIAYAMLNTAMSGGPLAIKFWRPPT